MNNLISITTGLTYQFIEDINDRVDILRQFKPEGIELNFISYNYLMSSKINKNTASYLRTLDYVSIHAPGVDLKYKIDDKETNAALKKISAISEQTKAKNIVFHFDFIDDLEVIGSIPTNVSIENNDVRYGPLNRPEDTKKFFSNNPKLSFCFDIAHAYSVDPALIDGFFEQRDRMIQIHTSFFKQGMANHDFLFKYDIPEIRLFLKETPSDIPLVLESVANTEDDIKNVVSEINYIRSI